LKHPSLPKVVDFYSGFLGSIPNISELSTLLVLRGSTPGIHGRKLLRRETPHQRGKDGRNAPRGCTAIRMSKNHSAVIASEAKQSKPSPRAQAGLLRRLRSSQ
jgi:hypothetical protein